MTAPRPQRARLVVFWDYDTQWGADADARRGLPPAPGALEFACTERLLELHARFEVPACFAVVGAAACAARAGYLLGRGTFGRAAAMTVAVWNPFVVERLLQGQWSLAVAAWLLPLVALGRGPAATLAHWLASLTPCLLYTSDAADE